MPRFYVAVGKKGTFTKTLKKTKEEVITEVKNKVLAEPSTIKIKQALANYPDTTWVFATFNIKFTLDNVLQLLRDYRKIDAEEIQEVKVSEGSRVTFHKITPKKIAK